MHVIKTDYVLKWKTLDEVQSRTWYMYPYDKITNFPLILFILDLVFIF